MDNTENYYANSRLIFLVQTIVKYGDLEFDFGKPFERITLHDATIKYGADKGIVKKIFTTSIVQRQPLNA